MLNALKYKEQILEWFYLDEDDTTIRRKKDDTLKGKFKKHQIVKPYKLIGNNKMDYKGIWVPGTGTTISLPWILIVLRNIDFEDGMIVDHIDGDITNNSRTNLRVTSQQTNCKNRKVRYDSSTGYTGINWHKNSKRYQVRITINKKRINRSHKTLEGAIRIREELKQMALDNGYTQRHFECTVQRPSKASRIESE